MNGLSINEREVLLALFKKSFINQKILSKEAGLSARSVGAVLKSLKTGGYITGEGNAPTKKAEDLIKKSSPRSAVILAAGFSRRMVPINIEVPKAMVEIYGEPLIERQIKQLHEAGIRDIYVVVGFMKEKFEYLIDEYSVKLIVNREYFTKNNLHSLKLILSGLQNVYIIPADIRCAENPFSEYELYSWYMVTDEKRKSDVVIYNKRSLRRTKRNQNGNAMIGISYLFGKELEKVKNNLLKLSMDTAYDNSYWEEALYHADEMIVYGRIFPGKNVKEINTAEDVRNIDDKSSSLENKVFFIIADTLKCNTSDIGDIEVLKKGMTNRSFLFSAPGGRYVMRIPGEGTDKLINRSEEAKVYKLIRNKNVCVDPVYVNEENGYMISKFISNARNCDPLNEDDLKLCMKKLRQFHRLNLKSDSSFDIFSKIQFYEDLCGGSASIYKDYKSTKENVMRLKSYIEGQKKNICLTHIDAVHDNFILHTDLRGRLHVSLIDWEYSAMQDPHVDIAMFCIYALYDKDRTDRLIDIYFGNRCSERTRIKIYCYIAACGLLWSNWCEYKFKFGYEFGEYSIMQYHYAKEYYKYAEKYLD